MVLLSHSTNAVVYNVRSDDSNLINSNDTESAESLGYYLKNANKFFSSYSTLLFLTGYHNLNTTMSIQNVTNVTLTGEGLSIIRCTSPVSIIIFNVTNFVLQNIVVKNCSVNYGKHLHAGLRFDDSSFISKNSINGTILLYQCSSVEINNITLISFAGNVGILIVNVRNHSKITNVSITIQISCPLDKKSSLQTKGILLYYDNWKNPTNRSSQITLDNFQFTTNGSCSHPIYYAITSLLFQNNTNVSVVIQNIMFADLVNVTALYYYGETCGIAVNNYLNIRNCLVSHNTGNPSLKMFLAILYSIHCIEIVAWKEQGNLPQYNHVSFINCSFVNNENMNSMIQISPASSQVVTSYFYLRNNTFHNNRQCHFFVMNSTAQNIWQQSNHVEISTTTITSNVHNEGRNLLSFANSWVKIYGNMTVMHNHYYTNILKFYHSSTSFQNHIIIYNNIVRQITSSFIIFIKENTTLNASNNTVYKLESHPITYGMNSVPICWIQFYGKLNASVLSIHAVLSNNIIMSKYYLDHYDFQCKWLDGSTIQPLGLQAKIVFGKLLEHQNNTIVSDKVYKRPIPLSICKCVKDKSDTGFHAYCYSPHLDSIFPGQTLKIELMVQKQWINHDLLMPIIAKNNNDCKILDTSQLSQVHFNNYDCNSYSYTLWPKNETIKTCKLHIGLPNMPETFYVGFKSCPLGFTLQESKKSCYCDPLLNKNNVIFIRSCNLSDETILRPAYSWIIAKKDHRNSITYSISSHCPFDHCHPYQSNLNLSNPDSQCQYNRTGLLCGKCQKGLSAVFGSHQCKHCSNINLLLILPFTIAGVVFVALLYIFNLTVMNGTVNTCIFYANIININVSIFFPDCQSFTCVILSYMNFDFRTNACFYNGMDDYFKIWIQLIFSFYLISIAVVFIVLSRYSAIIRRLTAKRVLPVLATLFLFSYTKVLIIVCNVLFRYSTISHLSSNKTELVWSISTATPIFKLKFLALFIVCLILFLILLFFNFILVFTRTLSFLNLITKFKPILDTYFGIYKDRTYYWTGLLLLVRPIIYVLPAIDKDMSLVIISAALGGLLCLHAALQPFKRKFYNIQECIAILNLLAVHSALLHNESSTGRKLAMIMITIGVVYFMIVIILQCCIHMYKCNNAIHKSIEWLLLKVCRMKESVWHKLCKLKASQEDNNNELENLKNRIPDVAYPSYQEFQEPLLAMEFDN